MTKEKYRTLIPIVSAVVIPLIMLIYNIGYAQRELDTKPSRIEVKAIVDTAVTKHEQRTKDNYVKINQVPGLNEQIESLKEKLDAWDKRFEKLENFILYGKRGN